MNLLRALLGCIKRYSLQLKYILLLFLATRIILTSIGILSRQLLKPYFFPPNRVLFSKHLWFDIWGQWDSGWYVNIAKIWYPEHTIIAKQCNYGFFPFYPILMKVTAFFTNDFFLGGLVVSNLSLIVACIVLVKLTELQFDRKISLASLTYMFLFPTAFMLSGALSESLYLALVLCCFYFAKKERWPSRVRVVFFLP